MNLLEQWKKLAKIENARMRAVAHNRAGDRSTTAETRRAKVKSLYMQGHGCNAIARALDARRTCVANDLKMLRDMKEIPDSPPKRMYV